jgi:hypothetical protein
MSERTLPKKEASTSMPKPDDSKTTAKPDHGSATTGSSPFEDADDVRTTPKKGDDETVDKPGVLPS